MIRRDRCPTTADEHIVDVGSPNLAPLVEFVRILLSSSLSAPQDAEDINSGHDGPRHFGGIIDRILLPIPIEERVAR